MIYLNKKDCNDYIKRPGAYAIIENEKNEIAVVKNDKNELFYFGGGLEAGETKIVALKREMKEETGYSLKDIKYFTEVGEFLKSQEGKYIEIMATIYLAKFDKYLVDPIEYDHHILWVKPESYQGKLLRAWQNYVLDLYINYKNNQGK